MYWPARKPEAVNVEAVYRFHPRFREAGVKSVRTMVDRRDHLILSFFRSQGMMAGPSLELEMELPA